MGNLWGQRYEKFSKWKSSLRTINVRVHPSVECFIDLLTRLSNTTNEYSKAISNILSKNRVFFSANAFKSNDFNLEPPKEGETAGNPDDIQKKINDDFPH